MRLTLTPAIAHVSLMCEISRATFQRTQMERACLHPSKPCTLQMRVEIRQAAAALARTDGFAALTLKHADRTRPVYSTEPPRTFEHPVSHSSVPVLDPEVLNQKMSADGAIEARPCRPPPSRPAAKTQSNATRWSCTNRGRRPARQTPAELQVSVLSHSASLSDAVRHSFKLPRSCSVKVRAHLPLAASARAAAPGQTLFLPPSEAQQLGAAATRRRVVG
jgi:hypothetical protein